MHIFIEQYGPWLGLLIYFTYKEIWPLLAKKIIPAQIKNSADRRTADLNKLEEDRLFHRRIETERLNYLQEQTTAIQSLANSMTQTNERIATILSNQSLILNRQDTTFSVLTDAIADMRAATGVKSNKE